MSSVADVNLKFEVEATSRQVIGKAKVPITVDDALENSSGVTGAEIS